MLHDLVLKNLLLVHKDKRGNVSTKATLCRQSGSINREESCRFSGFNAERVFVCDIQQTVKDTSKCKRGSEEKVVAKAEEDTEVKRVKAKD
jgi:hypothetical protein